MDAAMHAAIRWLGDFVRVRSGPWPDDQARIRVFAIAAVLIFSGLCVIVYDFRQPLWPLDTGSIATHLIYVAVPAGLFFRSRAAYFYAYLYVLVGSMTTAVALFMVPLAYVFRAVADEPLFALDAVLLGIFVCVLASFALGVWKLEPLYKRLLSWRASLFAPAYGLVVVGSVFVIAWSVVQAIAPTLPAAFLTDPKNQAVGLPALAIAALPTLASLLWAYISLRSRAVRDAFELP